MKALHIKSPSGKVHFVIADTLWHGINKVMKTEDYKYKTIEYTQVKDLPKRVFFS